MSEKIRDQISAFIDGELPVRECDLLLRRMRRDSELSLTFDRFGLIGDAIRDSLSGVPQGLLRSRVMQVVQGEQQFADRAGAWRRRGRMLRPAAGVAVAASVAVFAVLSLRAVDPAAPDATLAADAEPFAYSYTVPEPSYSPPVTAPPTRLTNYLVNHSQYANTLGRKSMQMRILVDRAETDEPREPE